MTAIELITPPQASGLSEPWSGARRTIVPGPSAQPTVGEEIDEILPLLGAVWAAGPPVVLVAGPWVLFALMLAGPFALLVTLVVLLFAVAALAGLIIAVPYLLVRHFRGHRVGPAPMRAPAVKGAWAARWDAA